MSSIRPAMDNVYFMIFPRRDRFRYSFVSRVVALNLSLTHSSQDIGSYLAGCSSSTQLGSTPHVSLKLNPGDISVVAQCEHDYKNIPKKNGIEKRSVALKFLARCTVEMKRSLVIRCR